MQKIAKKKSKAKHDQSLKYSILSLVIICFFILIQSYSILNLPFGADEIWQSTRFYDFHTGSPSFWEYFRENQKYFHDYGMLRDGQIFLLYSLVYFLPVRLYKNIFLILLNLTFALIFYKLALKTTGVRYMAILSTGFLFGISQIRPFFDPRINNYGIYLVYMIVLLVIVMIHHTIVFNEHKWSVYVMYSLLICFGTFYYQSTAAILLFLEIFLFAKLWIFQKEIWHQLKLRIIGLAAVSFSMLLITISFSFQISNTMPGYRLVLDDLDVLASTSWKQFRPTFPNIKTSNGDLFPAVVSIQDLLLCFVFLIGGLVLSFYLNALRNAQSDDKSNEDRISRQFNSAKTFYVMQLGISLIVIGVFQVSTLERWQSDLPVGLPYLSVGLQTMGVSLLFLSLLRHYSKRINERSLKALAIMICCGLTFTTISARFTLGASSPFVDSSWTGQRALGWEREIYVKALSKGFFSKINENGFEIPTIKVILDAPKPWYTNNSLKYSGNTNVEFLNTTAWWNLSGESLRDYCEKNKENCGSIGSFQMKTYASSYDSGAVVVTALNGNFPRTYLFVSTDRLCSETILRKRDGITWQKLSEGASVDLFGYSKLLTAKNLEGVLNCAN